MKQLTLNNCLMISGGKTTEDLALTLFAGIGLGAPLFALSGLYLNPEWTAIQLIPMGSLGAYVGAMTALSLYLVDSLLLPTNLVTTK